MAQKPSFTISPVRNQTDLQDTVSLFTEYAQSLGFDLSFQNFDDEMAAMPGKYTPPTGELLLARDSSGHAIGCVAVRPLKIDGVCEMKRLYVPVSGRGTGVGKALALNIIQVASNLKYSAIRLDTLPQMKAAVSMYEKFGFVDIEPYCFNPMEGVRFLSLKLPRQEPSDIVL